MNKIGIDIGGSKIRGVLVDGKNKIISDFNIETPKDKKLFLQIIEDEINKFLQKGKISKIGVGLPGVVDTRRNIFVKAANLPFLDGWQVVKFFKKFCKVVKIDNDSRCFLLAESKLGAGRGYKNIVGIAVGTGIGGAIMIDGKILYGANFGAGELGHMIIQSEGGIKSFEQLAGKKAYEEHGDRSEIIGIGVANMINILNPEIVILGGGAVSVGKVDIDMVKNSVVNYILSPLAKKTKIVKAKLGKNAQAIGATLL